MADAKISALTAATTPLAGTEVLPIVQSGTTKKVAVSSLTAGRAVSTGVLTVVNGTNPYIEMPDGTGTTYIQVASGDLNFVPRSGKNVSISNSNLIVGTAGKGIDFSANTHATGMTSELLNDYEEGTWTPTVASSVGSITSSTSTGKYTKIGRQVTIELSVTVTNNGTGADSIRIGGLPYAAESTGYAGAGFNTSSGEALAVGFAATSTLVVYKYNVLYPVITGQGFAIVVTYFV